MVYVEIFKTKNNNVEGNKSKNIDVKISIQDIKYNIFEDLNKGILCEFDKDNEMHKKNINELIQDNHNKYFKQYQETLRSMIWK